MSDTLNPSNRKTGKVKFFNSVKGFGFVVIDGAEADGDVFVHHTSIHNSGGFRNLAEGEIVEFDVVYGPKGMQAVNVTGPFGAPCRGDPKSTSRQFPRNPFMPPFAAYANPANPYLHLGFPPNGQPFNAYQNPATMMAQTGASMAQQQSGLASHPHPQFFAQHAATSNGKLPAGTPVSAAAAAAGSGHMVVGSYSGAPASTSQGF